MQRRGFMAALLAAGAAPAFVKAGTLMPLWVPNREIRALTYAEFERMLLKQMAQSLGLPYEQTLRGVWNRLYIPAEFISESSPRAVIAASVGKTERLSHPFLSSDAHWPGVERLFTGHSK